MNAKNENPSAAMRLHVALEVQDLQRSLDFYRLLFDAEPSKVRADYAKFEPAQPPVHLSLNAGTGRGRVGCEHFGIQLSSGAAVRATRERLRAAGLELRVEEATACCYSVQDKLWVSDPDGNPWEFFYVVEADSPHRTPVDATCCVPATAAADAEGEKAAQGCCG